MGSTRVVQITNIAPQATKDQMQSLFGSVGKIDEIRLYPTVRDVSCPVNSRICYVKYIEPNSVAVAQHLTNTVFIDRALIVIPVASGLIPDEYRALEMSSNGTIVPGLQKQNYKLPDEVVNRIDGMVPNQVVKTDDPKLVVAGLPEYPALPVNYDARKIEETRRTIVVIDIPEEWKLDGLMDFFRPAGEVKYARFAVSGDGKRIAMIEFCEQKMVIAALKMQGQEYDGQAVNIYHSTQPITKPEAKSNEAAQKEIEEAMSIVKEAQSMISAAIDPVIGMLGSKKSRTRSRSRSRTKRTKSREKSRSRDRRHKSRSRYSRSRSRSRRHKSRSRRSRSKSRSRRRRSRSREHRRRSRSRSRSHKRRTRSRDRRRRSYSRKRSHRNKDDRRHRSRSGSRARSKKHKERRRSRSHSRGPTTKHRSPSVERPKEKKREKSREKPLKRISEERPAAARDYDAEEKIGTEDDAERRSPSPPVVPKAADDMDISNSP